MNADLRALADECGRKADVHLSIVSNGWCEPAQCERELGRADAYMALALMLNVAADQQTAHGVA